MIRSSTGYVYSCIFLLVMHSDTESCGVEYYDKEQHRLCL